nr:hypothetical protein [Tanacetum cinerariifolium]
MEAQPEITQNISSLKLPMLKTEDYDLWSMRMEKYLTHIDYALWEVIINGDSPVPKPPAVGTVVPPKTEAQKLAKKNELKAKSTLLLAILDEHLLKFHSIKDAKSLLEAIKISINETINAAHDIPTASSKEQPSALSYADDVAMIIMRVKKFMKKTRRNLNFNGKEPVGFDKTTVERYNCHRRRHFARDFHAPRNQGNRSGDNERRVVPVETPASALVVQDGLVGYDWSYQAKEGPTDFALMAYSLDLANSSNFEVQSCSNECLQSFKNLQKQYDQQREILNKANIEILGYQYGLESLEDRIRVHQKNETVFEESITLLKYDVQVRDILIKDLKNYQVSPNDKTGLGYDSQLSENEMSKCEIFKAASNSSMSEIDEYNNQAKDRIKGYLIVDVCFACVGFQTTPQMVINLPCLTDKKELASPGQTETGKDFLNSLMDVKKVNDQEQIQAIVDKKKVIITEDSIRSDLHFDDAEGSVCLLNEAIFEGLTRMGAKTTAWNEFSSTMASTIICLADNKKFNFSKDEREELGSRIGEYPNPFYPLRSRTRSLLAALIARNLS